MEFGGNIPEVGNEEDDSNVLFSDDLISSSGDSGLSLVDPSDSRLSLEDSCLILPNPSGNLPQLPKQDPTPQYWQVPRQSMHVLDVLKKHGYTISKTKKDLKKDLSFEARILGKTSAEYIATYLPPTEESLTLFYRYPCPGSFDQLKDVLELKAVLDANKYPYSEEYKQDVLAKLNHEVTERSDLVKRLGEDNDN